MKWNENIYLSKWWWCATSILFYSGAIQWESLWAQPTFLCSIITLLQFFFRCNCVGRYVTWRQSTIRNIILCFVHIFVSMLQMNTDIVLWRVWYIARKAIIALKLSVNANCMHIKNCKDWTVTKNYNCLNPFKIKSFRFFFLNEKSCTIDCNLILFCGFGWSIDRSSVCEVSI